MKRKYLLLPLLLALALLLAGCGCDHQWNEADCLNPITCANCGEVDGEPLGHRWIAATCDTPQTCRKCGATVGDVLEHRWEGPACESSCALCGVKHRNAKGHRWADATCTEARTCAVCGHTEGDPLGHSWEAATCLYPKYCRRCGVEEGEAAGHSWRSDSTETLGFCTVCNKAVEFFAPEGETLAWTEYEIAADGTYQNPITYIPGRETYIVEWMKNGQLQDWCSQDIASTTSTHAYYVNGKVYYFSDRVYSTDFDTTGKKLANLAAKYISATHYWGSDGHFILLCGSDVMDVRGEVAAAVDADGKLYMLACKTDASGNPEKFYAIEYNWN